MRIFVGEDLQEFVVLSNAISAFLSNYIQKPLNSCAAILHWWAFARPLSWELTPHLDEMFNEWPA